MVTSIPLTVLDVCFGLPSLLNTMWNRLVLVAIVVNVVTMAAASWYDSEYKRMLLHNINTACIFFFYVEMGLKLTGLGCAQYWGDNWYNIMFYHC